jgi:hypothetical protein
MRPFLFRGRPRRCFFVISFLDHQATKLARFLGRSKSQRSYTALSIFLSLLGVSLDCSPQQSGNVAAAGEKMKTDIPRQIAQLSALSRTGLLEMWQKLYHKPAPDGIRREVMIPFLAYRMQENAYGGLKPSTRTEIRRIARNLEKPSGSTVLKARIKSGTRLLRQWGGETHEVVASESGFEYQGKRYRSLSEIARKITGTRWSGPAFFGTSREKASQGIRRE